MQCQRNLYTVGTFKSYAEIVIVSSTSLARPHFCTYFVNIETKCLFASLLNCKTSYFVYLARTCLVKGEMFIPSVVS
jgi:hypothetical protein